jgi:hypothetical protein
MTTITTGRAAHSPTARYLPLWTFMGRRGLSGKMHLAKVKTTNQPTTTAWCGGTYFVDRDWLTVTGEHALLLTCDAGRPTCLRCLAAIGAWEWEW